MSRKSKRNSDKPFPVGLKVGHTNNGEVVVMFNQPVGTLRMPYEQAANIAKQIFENAKAACEKSNPPPAIILPTQH